MEAPELKIGPFVLRPTQLEMEGAPEGEDWENALNFLLWIARNHPWWIGDLVTYGEARFGEAFYNNIVPDPTTADMIGRHAAIARAFKASERWPELSWTHHREVVRLKPIARKEVLQYALDKGIASGKMRDAVRAVKARG
ncbi:MAG: hypothetical protein CMK32_10200 [Porticoccaceae bacterium]|nr:hypothetical protein [Porticoccaceae bacterium]